jgi:hypothetical protein
MVVHVIFVLQERFPRDGSTKRRGNVEEGSLKGGRDGGHKRGKSCATARLLASVLNRDVRKGTYLPFLRIPEHSRELSTIHKSVGQSSGMRSFFFPAVRKGLPALDPGLIPLAGSPLRTARKKKEERSTYQRSARKKENLKERNTVSHLSHIPLFTLPRYRDGAAQLRIPLHCYLVFTSCQYADVLQERCWPPHYSRQHPQPQANTKAQAAGRKG